MLSFDLHRVWESLVSKIFGPAGIALALLSASIIFAVVVSFRNSNQPRSFRGFLRYLWPRDVIFHESAKADALFWLVRRALMVFMILPLTFSTVLAGHMSYGALCYLLGPPAAVPHESSIPMLALFTVSMFLVYDLAYYIYHRMQHAVPVLWELHKVHHSAEVMVGITKDRIHPLDDLMNMWWDGAIGGLAYGIWMFFLPDPVELTLFGISVYAIRQNILMMDFVRHTHMPVSYGKFLNAIFICPHYHQLHHSVDPRHYDRNFGLALALWDRVFGTLMRPIPNEPIRFGLMNEPMEKYRSAVGLYIHPILAIGRMSRSALLKIGGTVPQLDGNPDRLSGDRLTNSEVAR